MTTSHFFWPHSQPIAQRLVTKQRTIRELTEARDAIERLITTTRAA